jgi:methionyl-tRNA synthetase
MLKTFLTHRLPPLSKSRLMSTATETLRHHLITTPIFYVNAQPHVGHLHSALLADAASRWHRMAGKTVMFTTGTDEHGLKVQEAADASNQHPKEFCDRVSLTFRQAFNEANIQPDRFVRTTDDDHAMAVHTMWNKLVESGDLYCGTHEGWYCASDEVFLPDNQVVTLNDGTTTSVESGKILRWVSEENWKFKLSKYEDRLLQWLEPINGQESPLKPPERVNEVKEMILGGLRDISVSRLREKVPWAIPVPNDSKHSIYVWVDALTNYLTVTGFGTKWGGKENNASPFWPADCHIIGKDILRFHAIYWPAFLMASNLPLPRLIIAHGHWTSSKVKMSKSLGNVVSPTTILDQWGVDPVRYFFLRDGSLSNDADFSETNVSVRYVSELADTLGNLLSRCTGQSLLPNRKVKSINDHQHLLNNEDQQMIDKLNSLASNVSVQYNNYEFNKGKKKKEKLNCLYISTKSSSNLFSN